MPAPEPRTRPSPREAPLATDAAEPGEPLHTAPDEDAPRAQTRGPSVDETEAERLRAEVRRFIADRPLVALGGALVAGFVVGRILSR